MQKTERTVAIVGRPNVGKSALFNRLARQRISIVHDMPGVTRDRIAAECTRGNAPFTIFDTGGIGANVDPSFTEQVRAEVDLAIEAADVLLFVVDGQSGLTPLDAELARELRRISKPLILIVNKVDEPKHNNYSVDFTRLGLPEMCDISAQHGRGIDELVEKIEFHLPPPVARDKEAESKLPMKIALVGRPNVGKSSLINAILREERTLVSAIAGTTRDAVDIPFSRGNRNYILIDTAGIRQRSKIDHSIEYFSSKRSEDSIERADLVCLVIDAEQGVTSQDKRIAGLIQEARRPCVIALNKWDLITDKTDNSDLLREFLDYMSRDLFFLDYAPFILCSALQQTDITRLFNAFEKVRNASRIRIGTGPLNRILEESQTKHPPALVRNRRFKILYATQPEHDATEAIPIPEIMLFCNHRDLLEDNYRRYLDTQIRTVEPWPGLPIRFSFRGRQKRKGLYPTKRQGQAVNNRHRKLEATGEMEPKRRKARLGPPKKQRRG